MQLQVTHNNSSEVALHSGIERVDQVRSQQRLRLIAGMDAPPRGEEGVPRLALWEGGGDSPPRPAP